MNNFGILYIYELKKICMRKIVWITTGILVLMVVYMGVGGPLSTAYSYTTDGEETVQISGFEFLAMEKANAEALNGQAIDDAMLEEVKDAYGEIHIFEYRSEDGTITGTGMTSTFKDEKDENEETRKERNRKRDQYKEIYTYVRNVMGNYEAVNTISEEILYQTRLSNLEYNWSEQKLTEEEKLYWTEKENTIDKPFVYGYAQGWEIILEEFLSLNVMLVLAIAICLSNVFSDEHLRKTDQLILCSKYGKKILFFSKMAAGVTFGVICGAVFLLLAVLSTLCVYGAEGFGVAVQVYLPTCSWNLSMGQAVLLMGIVYIVFSLFCSIAAMFLSEAMKNSVAVMGFMTGSMIITMLVSVPYCYRVLSQIYALLPTVLLSVWQLWDNRLVKVFGVYFANFQIAPVIYIIISGILIFWGNHIYKKYQVSGR